MSKLFNVNSLLFLFYLSLLVLMMLGPTNSAPNSIFRYSFILMFFLPLFFKRKVDVPAFLLCFLIIMYNIPVFCPLPYALNIYIFILIIGIVFFHCYKSHNIPAPFFVLLLFMCVMDCLFSGQILSLEYSFIIILLLVYYMDFSDTNSIDLFISLFCVVSVMLSICFFIHYDEYAVSFGDASAELERSGWTDPNYFSSVIGMGCVNAVYLLLKNKNDIYCKSFLLFTVLISILAVIALASRGALFAIVVAITYFLIVSDIQIKYKVLFVVMAFVIISFLFTHNFLDLLIYRLENDSGTGSGRTIIWQKKLGSFSQFNILEMLFGVGLVPGLELGSNGARGFHNDYIGFLCCYGIVGVVLFIYSLIYPIRRASKRSRPTIIVFVLYLMAVCLTLEPFLTGLIAFFGFYLLVVSMAEHSRINELK